MIDYYYKQKHTYSLSVEGLKIKTQVFYTRPDANSYMYALMGKYHLVLEQVYDDKHDKTYIFTNGIRIHINRA